MKVIEDEDLVDQQLISELRKEYGMTYNDFFMVLTDTDMKVKVRFSTLWTQLSWKKMHWKHMKKNGKFRKLHFTCVNFAFEAHKILMQDLVIAEGQAKEQTVSEIFRT